ncbi:MAG: hypothetical protein ABI679_16695 [Gemmatimonadota bacterium]
MQPPAPHHWEQTWPNVLPGRPGTPAVGPATIPAHFRCRVCGLEGRRVARDRDEHAALTDLPRGHCPGTTTRGPVPEPPSTTG